MRAVRAVRGVLGNALYYFRRRAFVASKDRPHTPVFSPFGGPCVWARDLSQVRHGTSVWPATFPVRGCVQVFTCVCAR